MTCSLIPALAYPGLALASQETTTLMTLIYTPDPFATFICVLLNLLLVWKFMDIFWAWWYISIILELRGHGGETLILKSATHTHTNKIKKIKKLKKPNTNKIVKVIENIFKICSNHTYVYITFTFTSHCQ